MISVFAEAAQEYDGWFDRHAPVYQSELRALQTFLPPAGRGLEIGAGTGRFAAPLGIEVGVEPARAMAAIARSRGLKVCAAYGEELPFRQETFDFVLLVTVLCFLKDPGRALAEARRVLKPRGKLLIGLIDPDSPLGRAYEQSKAGNKFYRRARFYPVRRVLAWLEQLDFGHLQTCQTIFQELPAITAVEPVRPNYGEGGFVVIAAQKI